jgi:chromosome segregation ATPase
LAKSSGAATAPKSSLSERTSRRDNEPDIKTAYNSDLQQETELAEDGATVGLSLADLASAVEEPVSSVKKFDLSAVADVRDRLDGRVRDAVQAFEQLSQQWRQLDTKLTEATKELERLGPVEADQKRLAMLYAVEKTTGEKLQADLLDITAREATANERIKQLEEIVETIKERAFEIHTGLQQSRANEQKAQTEIASLRAEVTEMRRVNQDETVARTAAEDRARKLQEMVTSLEAVEAEARDRVAKLVQDNKVMATQVPQLLAERDKWQKQFSASERENTRMQSERRVMNERAAELEDEIRTLRADMASLSPAAAAASVAASAANTRPPSTDRKQVAEPAQQAEAEDDIDFSDELDLVSSLDRAFAVADDEIAESSGKKPH